MPGRFALIFLQTLLPRRPFLSLGLAVVSILLLTPGGQAGILDLEWTAPTTNTDGSALTDLSGYRVYWGTSSLAPCPPSSSPQFVSSPTPSPAPNTLITSQLTGLTTGTTYFVRVTAVDLSSNESACSPEASGVAQAEPLNIITASLPAGTVGAIYNQTLAATGGTGAYTWSLAGGTLPAGLSVNSSTGVISGTPTTAGTSNFTVRVTDASAATDDQPLSIIVSAPAPLNITTTSLTAATVGSAYSRTLTATGGITPYTWSRVSGTLPAGLALSSGGVISGTPTTAGTSSFTVRVTDSAPTPATKDQPLTLTVNTPPPPGSSDSGGGGGGCFIATAAYGSALEPQVVLLREFRDQYLLTNRLGQAFVQWYYHTSPPFAETIRPSPTLRGLVRVALWPVVGLAWVSLHPGGAGVVVLGGIGVLAVLLCYRRKDSRRASVCGPGTEGGGRTQEKSYMKRLHLSTFIGSLLLLTLFSSSSAWGATTYYIAPNGSDTNSGTSTTAPWATFVKAFSVMAGGDTLIVKNGTYFQEILDPPSGTATAYTVIRAENDGGAIIDGRNGLPTYPNGPINVSNRSFIRFEGLKCINGGETVISIGGSSIELKRIGAAHANSANEFAVVIALIGSNHLLEDVWAWGYGRYLIEVHGSGHTFRRVVVRHDAYTGPQPVAGMIFYDATGNTVDNFIGLDFNTPSNPNQAFAAIYGKGSADNNKVYGAIALNIPQFISAYNTSEFGGKMDITNSVAWDVTGAAGVRFVGGGGGTLDQMTIKGASPTTSDTSGLSVGKNMIIYNSGSTSLGTNNFNLFFNSPVPPGALNVISGLDPQLKYILRSECATQPTLPQCLSGEIGKTRGANITKRYLNGVETSQTLWPWPNEARIKSDMCAGVTRGFCSKASLTEYIWTYLGNPNPYADTTTPTAPPSVRVP